MKKMLRIVAIALAVAMMAAACGGSDDADTDEGATTEDQSSDNSTDDGDGESSDESDGDGSGDEVAATGSSRFVYANPFPIFDLDPASAFSSENVVLQNVYETLTTYNPPGSADLISGALAESWTSNDDATEWTFTLREGVTFHDGSPMNAEAVIASLQRTIDLDLGAAFILLPILEMTATDDLTVTFTLEYPAPLDIVMSSNYGAFIMSTEGVSQESDWFNEGNEAGTGPYTIASYTPNESVELARYDDYWGSWSDGQFDTAEIQLVEDPVLAEQMVRNGDADFTYNLPFDSYAGLEGVEGLSVVRGESMQNLFGLLNHERLSPEVREALVLSFPYDDVVEAFYGGESTRSQGIIPQAVWGSSNSLDLPETDLDAAAKVLADAGVTDLSVTYSFDAGTTEQQQFGEVWRANLATIGVDLVLDPLTFDARWELAQADPANAQDVFTLFWFPTFVTPYDFMFSLFRTEEAPFFNLGYYSNPDFDALIDEADAVSGTDRDAAIALFQEASQILIDDNAAVFMVAVPNIGVINSDVSGYVSNPAYSGVVRFYDLTHSG
jgi:peptide/nickel transport system substrate-binding protein